MTEYPHLLISAHDISFHSAGNRLIRATHELMAHTRSHFPDLLHSPQLTAMDVAARTLSHLVDSDDDEEHLAMLLAHEVELERSRRAVSGMTVADLVAQRRAGVGALQVALQFIVSTEPTEEEQCDPELERRHALKIELLTKEVLAAESIVRGFATRLPDKSLPSMQAAYYGITNSSYWVAQGNVALSAIGSTMKSQWSGVGEWHR